MHAGGRSGCGAPIFGQSGFRRHAVQGLAGQAIQQGLASMDQSGDVDAGRNAHGFEHEHQVFGDHIARGAGCIGAAPKPAKELSNVRTPTS